MSSKQFNIILGDSVDLIKTLNLHNDFKCLINQDNWTLNSTSSNLYWVIGDEVKNLKHQFIIFKNPIIYIFFNYHLKNSLELIQRFFALSQRDLTSYTNKKFIIIGINYKDIKFQKTLKKNVLQWCIEQEKTFGPDFCAYHDYDDYLFD
jgi:hypothetical protein